MHRHHSLHQLIPPRLSTPSTQPMIIATDIDLSHHLNLHRRHSLPPSVPAYTQALLQHLVFLKITIDILLHPPQLHTLIPLHCCPLSRNTLCKSSPQTETTSPHTQTDRQRKKEAYGVLPRLHFTGALSLSLTRAIQGPTQKRLPQSHGKQREDAVLVEEIGRAHV